MKTSVLNHFRWVAAILLTLSVAILPSGCSLIAPKPGTTWEATQYLSFKDTWTTTLALYDHAKDLQVAGKISAKDAADIDRAWNVFRAAYKTALANARGDKSIITPDSVAKLANDVITLIYSAT